MELIQSVQNTRVKEWSKLSTKKGREKEGAFLIEGTHVIEEAIRANAPIQSILIEEGYSLERQVEDLVLDHPSPKFRISEQVVKKLAGTETPQGIFAVVKIERGHLEHMWEGEPLLLLLDAVQDPGNLGTIIRTADAAGMNGIILGKGTVDVYNPKVVRSTMGSLFHLPIVQADLPETVEQMAQKGFKLIAASLEGAVAYDESLYQKSVGIIIGNEGNGVSEELLQRCSAKVKIPIYGQAESLNAAIAAGIIMYEAIRQRK